MNNISRYLTCFRYGIFVIFEASRKYFFLKLIFMTIQFVLQYLPLIIWRDIINIFNEIFTTGTNVVFREFICYIAIYCTTLLILEVVDCISSYISKKYSDCVQFYLDEMIINKVSTIDIAGFDSGSIQNLLNNSWSMVDALQALVWRIFDIIKGTICLIVSAILLSQMHIMFLPLLIIVCIPSIICNKKIFNLALSIDIKNSIIERKLYYYRSAFSSNLLKEIKLLGIKDYYITLFNDCWNTLESDNQCVRKYKVLYGTLSTIAFVFSESLVYIMSVLGALNNIISLGDVTYYGSIVSRFQNDFLQLCDQLAIFSYNIEQIEIVREFMDLKAEIVNSGNRTPSYDSSIEFRNVYFRYPDSQHDVLQNCSFVIGAGEIVGIVGRNGSGKSTIVKLLCRFYDPLEGEILIDGINIKEYDIVKLRKMFGVLFQDYVHYSLTLRENIALSDILRVTNDSAICNAAIRSNVYEFCKEWEKGVDENLTRQFDPDGKELSGGQWQRVSLARAIFRDSPIMLLDEPSASLDPIAEHKIFEDSMNIIENKTAILITHRLSSIMLVDRILVLADGKIIEQGKHEELITKDGEYAHMFKLQASKYCL